MISNLMNIRKLLQTTRYHRHSSCQKNRMAFKGQNTNQYSIIHLCLWWNINCQWIHFKRFKNYCPYIEKEALQKICTGHMGIEKCTERAKECIYWPNINAHIKYMINTCSYCIDYKNQQPAEPLKNYEIPTTPWIKVSTDIFHLFGKSYVTIIDYTRFFDLHKIKDCQTKTVIKRHFCQIWHSSNSCQWQWAKIQFGRI